MQINLSDFIPAEFAQPFFFVVVNGQIVFPCAEVVVFTGQPVKHFSRVVSGTVSFAVKSILIAGMISMHQVKPWLINPVTFGLGCTHIPVFE